MVLLNVCISFSGNDIGSNVETGGPGFSCSATCVDNLKLHDNIGILELN